jgi:hypothetical protein
LLSICSPFSGQQGVKLGVFAILYFIEHIGEPFHGIDIVEFAGSHEGVNDGRVSGSLVVATEQVLSKDYYYQKCCIN